jgi:hypothetical protein
VCSRKEAEAYATTWQEEEQVERRIKKEFTKEFSQPKDERGEQERRLTEESRGTQGRRTQSCSAQGRRPQACHRLTQERRNCLS